MDYGGEKERLNTNVAERWDWHNKAKTFESTVDEHITNLIELSRLLNNIVGGIRTWTPGQQSVLFAHLDIWLDAISRCSSSTAQFRQRIRLLQEERNQYG